MLNGIDVYEGNNINSWQQVKNSGIQTVIIKASQGVYHTDSLFYYRIPKVKQAGLYLGYYHFAEYNSTNPIGEAKHFLNVVSGHPSDTVLWVDVEIDNKWNKQIAIDYTNQFVNYVQNQGYKIGLYTGQSFYENYLKGNIPNIPLWIAKYSSNPPSTYPTHSWQYSETGRVNGIVGYSDMDKFNENILLSKSIPQIEIKQANSFCKNSISPILPYPFLTNSHVEFKASPDSNASTNATREAGFQVMVYGKDGAYYSVNKNGTQFLPISLLKGTQSCVIQKVLKITVSEVNCYENPDKNSTVNGKLTYGKTVAVYYIDRNFALVNGQLTGLQWICLEDGVEQIYPNVFTDKLNKDTLPILEGFQVNVDSTEIKEFPHAWSKTVGNLKKGDLVQVYGSFEDYYLISNDEKKFIKIQDLIATKPLNVIKKVKVITYEGAMCRPLPDISIPNNGIVSYGKELPVYKEYNDFYMIQATNKSIQFTHKSNCEDIL